MEKTLKRNSKLEELPFDCWSVITSFFSHHLTSLNVLRVNKRTWEISTLRTIRFFEHVVFPLRTDKVGRECMDQFGEIVVPFVRILSISHKLHMKSDEENETLFSENVKNNDKNLRRVFRKFCHTNKLEIGIKITPSVLKYLPVTCRSLKPRQCFSLSENSHFFSKLLHHYLNESNIETLELEEWKRNKKVVKNLDFSQIKSLKTLILDRFGEMMFYSSYEIDIMGSSDYERGDKEFKFENSELETLILKDYQFNTINQKRNSGIILKFPNLRRLEIQYLYDPTSHRSYFTNPSTFIHLKKLEFLKLSGSHFQTFQHNKMIDPLFYHENHFKNIKYLDISYNLAFDGSLFPYLSKTLEVLIMHRCGNIKFEYVKTLKNLKHLDCKLCNQSDLNDEVLMALNPEKMEYLALCRCHSQEDISDRGFAHFRKLKYLSIMACSSKGITDDIIQMMFKNNKNLKKLKLEHNIILIRKLGVEEGNNNIMSIYFEDEKYEGRIKRAEMKWKNDRNLARWIEVFNEKANEDKIFKCSECKVDCFPDRCLKCYEFTCCFCNKTKQCYNCRERGCENCVTLFCVIHRTYSCEDKYICSGEEGIPNVKCEVCKDPYCDNCIGVVLSIERGVLEGCYACKDCVDVCGNCKTVLSSQEMKEKFEKMFDEDDEEEDEEEEEGMEWYHELRTYCTFCEKNGCVNCLPVEKCGGIGCNFPKGCENCKKSCKKCKGKPCFSKCECGCNLNLCDKCKKKHNESKKE